MLKNRLFWIIAAGAIGTIVVGFGIYQVVLLFSGSFGRSINVTTNTPDPAQSSTTEGDATTTPTPTDSDASTSTTCNQSGDMVVLLLAADEALQREEPYGADGIRFVRIDFDSQSVQIVSIPRDLWVNTPTLAGYGVQESRLGTVYDHAKQNVGGDKQGEMHYASEQVAQTIYDNFSVAPDYYITIEANYGTLIDSIGGIDISLPEDFSTQGYDFKAGPQHFNGAQALAYIRALTGDTEWSRLERQNRILRTLRNELLGAAILPKIPDLLVQFSDSFITDMETEEINDLICIMEKVPSSNITFYEVEADMVNPGPDGSMAPKFDLVSKFLQDILDDGSYTEIETQTCKTSGEMIVLMLAADEYVNLEEASGADGIRFIRLNFSTPSVKVISIPRHLWVATPILSGYGVQNTYLGSTYNYGKEYGTGNETDKIELATEYVAQTIYDNFTVVADYYITIEASYAQLIDAIGGIDITVPEEFTGSGYTFRAGPQHFDGAMAQAYIRSPGESEWARLARQDLVLNALRTELLDPVSLTNIPELLIQFNDSFITNMNPGQFDELVCLLETVPPGNISYAEVSESMTDEGPENSLLADFDQIEEFLQKELGQ